MTFIVVTRLRLRDPSFFDDFLAAAVAVVEQAQSSEGNLAADVLGEANIADPPSVGLVPKWTPTLSRG